MPRNAQPVPTESVEQICLFRWAAYQAGAFPELEYLYHVPNGGHRHMTTAKRLKSEGVKAGVPDICLPVPRAGYHGLYIEMKRSKGGSTSSDQGRWLAFLSRHGYCTAVCHGWEAASEVIMNYLKRDDAEIKQRLSLFRILRGVVIASALPKTDKATVLKFIERLEGAA